MSDAEAWVMAELSKHRTRGLSPSALVSRGYIPRKREIDDIRGAIAILVQTNRAYITKHWNIRLRSAAGPTGGDR